MPPSDLTAPPSAPATLSVEAAIASANWPDLTRRLTRYAHVRLRKSSWETAEEIAQEAVLRLVDPAYASWDRERHPDLFDCLGHIVNGLVANHQRKRVARGAHVPLRDDEKDHDDELPQLERELKSDEPDAAPAPRNAVHLTDARTAESELTQARDQTDHAELAMAALRARLDGDKPALRLLDAIKSGVGTVPEQAKLLRASTAEIYVLRRRLMDHTRAVGRDLARQRGES